MGYTFESALDNDLVTVVERNDEMGNFVIRIGVLETEVSIDLYRCLNSDQIISQVSHAMKTPLQIEPYVTSRPFEDSPGNALRRAVDSLTSYYREAVSKGHNPSDDWLVVPGQLGMPNSAR